MSVVTATCQSCEGLRYVSSPIKHERHELNAWTKAVRLAQEHSKATSHDVHVDHGATHRLVACRCARCERAMPGDPCGICADCLELEFPGGPEL